MHRLWLLKTLGVVISLLTATDLAWCPQPVSAGGQMYWTTITGPSMGKIQRAKTDGSGVKDVVSGLDFPVGLALDPAGCKMYWTEYDAGQIRRADLAGSNVETLVSDLNNVNSPFYPHNPVHIAVDLSQQQMYWANDNSGQAEGTIHRAGLDGSGVEAVITGQLGPTGIALDVVARKVYWGGCCNFDVPGNDKIRRANFDGSGVEDLVTDMLYPNAIALDVAGGKMYWAHEGRDEIQRANLDGSSVEDLVNLSPFQPFAITLDLTEGVMYWGAKGIQRANLDGTSVEGVVPGVVPHAIALLPPLRLASCGVLELKHLVDSCEPCDPRPKQLLLDKVSKASRQLDKGHTRPALNALRQFQQQTERLVEAGQLPAAEGRRFIDLTEQIVGEL